MNRKNGFYFLIIFAFWQSLIAQKDGYWDKERSTNREVEVSARGRIVIKTEALPTGTTELVYRITLLDLNQKMANSLVAVLKSIPDPTGISQGSAGAVFLLSQISGDDKCNYAIFTNESSAIEYQKSGSTKKACYVQTTPVSKDVKGISATNSLCKVAQSNVLWFGFESSNWVMKQKVMLEVVPWINSKLATGWNLDSRKLVLNQCKTSELAKKVGLTDNLCLCVLEKLQKKFTFLEYQTLLAAEKVKAISDLTTTCLQEAGPETEIYTDLRMKASALSKEAKYAEAIANTDLIFRYGKATLLDYATVGYCYLMTKRYSKALKVLQDGEKIDDSDVSLMLNLAHAYLLTDNFKMSKSIHKKYQFQNISASQTWIEKVKQDFGLFKDAGLPTNDFDRILKLLEE